MVEKIWQKGCQILHRVINIVNSYRGYFLPRTHFAEIVIFDDFFPGKLSAFRYQEFSLYLQYFKNMLILVSSENHLAKLYEKKSLKYLINSFKNEFVNNQDVVRYFFRRGQQIKAKLAYCVFIHNMIWFLPMLEKNKIPFVFTLYPGGGFRPGNTDSDNSIRRVCLSPYFRKVIVTQKITLDYLISKNLCPKEKIKLIYGGFSSKFMTTSPKKYYRKDKLTFDICFVAHKNYPAGMDKGYDVFIEIAKKLTQQFPDIRFHVVGGFDGSEFNISILKEKIFFYPPQKTEFFEIFYQDKDLILSPNPAYRPDQSFDGFPTGCCVDAMLNRVALFCTDELCQNLHFVHEKDIVIISRNVDQILHYISYYYNHYDNLVLLAENGYQKASMLFDPQVQISARIKIFENELKK